MLNQTHFMHLGQHIPGHIRGMASSSSGFAMFGGMLVIISCLFTVYKSQILQAKEKLEQRRAWRKRNLQGGKELAQQAKQVGCLLSRCMCIPQREQQV